MAFYVLIFLICIFVAVGCGTALGRLGRYTQTNDNK